MRLIKVMTIFNTIPVNIKSRQYDVTAINFGCVMVLLV